MMSTFCILIIGFINCCLSEWISGNGANYTTGKYVVENGLPRETHGFAIGVYGDRIIMMGGKPERYASKQLFQYDITHDIFIDNGTSVLSQEVWNWGSFYTQIADTLYMMDFEDVSIHTYDLSSNQFVPNVATSLIQDISKQCLAATNDYLLVTGGIISTITTINTVQMMDLSTKTWSYAPNMSVNRHRHSCVIDPTTNILYVIGGIDGARPEDAIMHKSIETINTNNINQQSWMHYGYLEYNSYFGRSVWYNHNIFVVASKRYPGTTYFTHIINTIDGTISYEPFKYQSLIGNPGVTVVDSILYVFGGDTQAWVYYNLSTYTSTISSTVSSSNKSSTGFNEILIYAAIFGLVSVVFSIGIYCFIKVKKSDKITKQNNDHKKQEVQNDINNKINVIHIINNGPQGQLSQTISLAQTTVKEG
eukprot:347052_1